MTGRRTPDPEPTAAAIERMDTKGSSTGAGWPRPIYAWYVVVLLTLAYVVSMIDRQILSLLIEPVKRDLAINDTAFGLLHGFAFGLFYTLVGVPIAWLADRASRRNIIVVGVLLWSLMTAACGLARDFGTLFLARMGVGVGEAALSPSVLSMLADIFPRERLSTAVSLYTNGAYWGTGLALILGGAVVELVAGHPLTTLPLVGDVRSWQLTFFIVALPGLLLLPLLLTIREPLRRGTRAAGTIQAEGLAAFLRAHGSTIVGLYLGFALLVLITVTVFAWTPALFIRRFGWAAGEIGYAFGLVVLIAGTAGINLGGLLTDRLVRRGITDAPLRVGAAGAAAVTVLVAMMANAPDARFAIAASALLVFTLAFPAGAGMAAIQMVVPNRLRARMSALFVLVSNLIAMLLGPPLVGVCTDYVFRDPAAIGAAMTLVCGIAGAASAAVMTWGAGHYRRSNVSLATAARAAALSAEGAA